MSEDDFDDLDEFLDELADDILDQPVANQNKEKKDETDSSAEKSNQQKEKIATEPNKLGENDLKTVNTLMQTLLGDEYDDEAKKVVEEQMAKFSSVLQGGSGNWMDEMLSMSEETNSGGETKKEEKMPENFNDVISSTLSRLKDQDSKVDASLKQEEQEKEQNKNMEMMAEFFKELGLDDMKNGVGSGVGDSEDSMEQFMEKMQRQMATKETLYEPMKIQLDKYETWFKEHLNTDLTDFLLEVDKKKYSAIKLQGFIKQRKIIEETVKYFETSDYDDNSETCHEYVYKKTKELADSGSPPDELMEETLNDEALKDFSDLKDLKMNPEDLQAALANIPESDCAQQ